MKFQYSIPSFHLTRRAGEIFWWGDINFPLLLDPGPAWLLVLRIFFVSKILDEISFDSFPGGRRPIHFFSCLVNSRVLFFFLFSLGLGSETFHNYLTIGIPFASVWGVSCYSSEPKKENALLTWNSVYTPAHGLWRTFRGPTYLNTLRTNRVP
jgi:hypothetical protein